MSRRKQHEGVLCNFGGLNGQRAQTYPARCAVICNAYAGDKDEREQHRRQGGERILERGKFFIGHECGGNHGKKPYRPADELLCYKKERVVIQNFADIAACRIHHDAAERSHASRADEQRDVADIFRFFKQSPPFRQNF